MKLFIHQFLKHFIPQYIFIFTAVFFLSPVAVFPHHNTLELSGEITNISDSTLTIEWLTINVDANTVIKDREGNIVPLSNFIIGDYVEVKAYLTSEGSFIATSVKLENEDDHDNELEVNAIIEEIDSSSIKISGIQIYVDEDTQIKRGDHESISFEDLNRGDSVEVDAKFKRTGYFLADKIEVETDNHSEPKLETKGFITELSDSSLTVNGFNILVDESTKIHNRHHIILFKDLNVGDFVNVKAIYQPDSTLLAKDITLLHQPEIEFTGTIESIDTSSLVVNGLTVIVNENTKILLDDHDPINFGDLTIGMLVEVKALLQPDSTFLALRIEVEDQDAQHIRITAPIDTIFSSSLIVGGITFETDTNTVIIDDDDNPTSFDSLKIGMIVKIRGILISPEVYLATLIKVKDFWCSDTDIMGTLKSVSSVSINIGEKECLFTPLTIMLDQYGRSVNKSYFSQGMQVNVRTNKNLMGIEEIVRIKVKNRDEIDFSGIIDEVAADRITIGNKTVELQGYTFITYLNGIQVLPSELKAGLFVNTQIILIPNQVTKATYIEISNDPDVFKTTGTVIEKTNDYIVVSQPQFQIENSTVILNSEYKLTDYNSIKIGDNAAVWAQSSAGGNLTALQIQSLTNSATNVNDPGSVTEYSLSQNYPNPFNPNTIIRFTLPEGAFVSLKVYNVIGEEVASLVNDNLDRGVYNINFDASNLPSAVYLYRIKANNFTQVHKMLLVK